MKEERRQYTEWLMSNGLNCVKLFIYEFGVNVWTSRSSGRATFGQRAVRIVEGQRGKNLTICLTKIQTQAFYTGVQSLEE